MGLNLELGVIGIGEGEPLSAYPKWVKLWACILFASCLSSCDKSIPKIGGGGDASVGELAAANLAAHEGRNQTALHSLNYTNLPTTGNLAGIRLASGRLLSSNDGRFKFEQTSSDANKSFLVHFDPQAELTVVFPRLQRSYSGPSLLLTGAEASPVHAAYEGMLFLLGQGNVWSDPSRTQFTLTRGGADLQRTGSPLRWEVRFEPTEYLFPVEELSARAGSRTLLTIDREAFSYESLDMSGGGGIPPLSGGAVRGSEVQVKSWRFMTPRGSTASEIQLNPVGESEARTLIESGALDPPSVPEGFRRESLTPEMLSNWLNLR